MRRLTHSMPFGFVRGSTPVGSKKPVRPVPSTPALLIHWGRHVVNDTSLRPPRPARATLTGFALPCWAS